MSLTHETAEWADGPRLCAWLEEKGVKPAHFGAMGRRATDWRKGSAADFYTVDSLLTQAGLFVWELPDDVWREPPVRHRFPPPGHRNPGNRFGAKLSVEQVLVIRREVRGGATRKGLARRYGVTPKTISNVVNGATWKQEAA